MTTELSDFQRYDEARADGWSYLAEGIDALDARIGAGTIGAVEVVSEVVRLAEQLHKDMDEASAYLVPADLA